MQFMQLYFGLLQLTAAQSAAAADMVTIDDEMPVRIWLLSINCSPLYFY